MPGCALRQSIVMLVNEMSLAWAPSYISAFPNGEWIALS